MKKILQMVKRVSLYSNSVSVSVLKIQLFQFRYFSNKRHIFLFHKEKEVVLYSYLALRVL